MELAFLGTASSRPSSKRNVTCTAIRHSNGEVWLIDCGEGSQHQIMKSDVKMGAIRKIFITHLHGDHAFGLPGLLCSMSQSCPQLESPIEIFGPVGLRKMIVTSLALSQSMALPFVVHELVHESQTTELEELTSEWMTGECIGKQIGTQDGKSWKVTENDVADVEAGILVHANIMSVGYVFKEVLTPSSKKENGRYERLGALNSMHVKEILLSNKDFLIEKYACKNVMQLMSKIKGGEVIELPDGSIDPLDPQVTGPSITGQKVCVLGDTCDSDAMIETGVVLDCDVIVHETTLGDEDKDLAIDRGHSTPGMAGTFAKSANAKALVLFHFSQRFAPNSEEEKILVQQANYAFLGESQDPKKARVFAAHDFITVSIKKILDGQWPMPEEQKLENA